MFPAAQRVQSNYRAVLDVLILLDGQLRPVPAPVEDLGEIGELEERGCGVHPAGTRQAVLEKHRFRQKPFRSRRSYNALKAELQQPCIVLGAGLPGDRFRLR